MLRTLSVALRNWTFKSFGNHRYIKITFRIKKFSLEQSKVWKNNWNKKKIVRVVVLAKANIEMICIVLEVLAIKIRKEKGIKATKLERKM